MNIETLLEKSVLNGASDLHLSAGAPPTVRVDGMLEYIDENPLTPKDCEEMVRQCIREDLLGNLVNKGQIDASLAIPGVARFRINVYKQRGSYAIAVRMISTSIPKLETLGLPSVVIKLAEKQRGLIVVTGPTGSGKSTTLASMLDYINNSRRYHIVTIEDPIEYLHKHCKSIMSQREIGSDTENYSGALRAVLREDPDVIMIGEMRDQETISTALTAAETGHLVLSTLHTIGAAKTIDRIIDVFPPHQQNQVRMQLSTVLQGIISQQLISRKEDKGRIVATEVMVMNPALANLIREAKTPQINTVIHTSAETGMHSMDVSIARLYKKGMISYQNALQYSVDPENMDKLIAYQ